MAVVPKVSSRKIRRRGSMPAAKTFHAARSTTTSGRSCSAAWRDFFEAEFEFLQRVPQVGDRRVELEVALEVFERGTRLGGDLGANAIAFTLGQGLPLVSAGLVFEGLARLVEALDGPHPDRTDAEDLGDFRGRQGLLGECDDAVAKLDGKRSHCPT